MPTIADLETRLNELKDAVLAGFDVPRERRTAIALAASPGDAKGDYGFPVFAATREIGAGPPPAAAQVVAEQLAELARGDAFIAEVVAVGPYVNIVFDQNALTDVVVTQALAEGNEFGHGGASDETRQSWVIEFSAPNTNKPQHLGHVRNNLLGESVARTLAFSGQDVTRVNLINDRGIHICKSMIMYQRFGEGRTPESEGIKGDHLVGVFYVKFNTEFQAEYAGWQGSDEADAEFAKWRGSSRAKRVIKKMGENPGEDALKRAFFKSYEDVYFNQYSALGADTKEMLVAWEDTEHPEHASVRELWSTMNQWVFDGFDETYDRLGIAFDEVYYESETYKLGKDLVLEHLERGTFQTADNGAVVAAYKDIPGMKGDRQKVLLRGDGTSVYMTQDLGTATKRFETYDMDRMMYVVGNEQDEHFKVLFGLLELMDPAYAGRLHHLSYGMVELPEGRMKTRTGTVVDADNLMDGMVDAARAGIIASNIRRSSDSDIEDNLAIEDEMVLNWVLNDEKTWDELREEHTSLTAEEFEGRVEAIGLAAIKLYILKPNPTTTVSFDPKASIQPNGDTGVYALYTYARIQSIGRRAGGWPALDASKRVEALGVLGTPEELDLVRRLQTWPDIVRISAESFEPSKIVSFTIELCRAFSRFNNAPGHKVIEMESPRKEGALLLLQAVGHALHAALTLLGITPLEEM